MAGAVAGVAFERFTEGKEHHHHAGFGVRTNDNRPDRGNRHQHVDVEFMVDAQGTPRTTGNR